MFASKMEGFSCGCECEKLNISDFCSLIASYLRVWDRKSAMVDCVAFIRLLDRRLSLRLRNVLHQERRLRGFDSIVVCCCLRHDNPCCYWRGTSLSPNNSIATPAHRVNLRSRWSHPPQPRSA